MVTANWEKSYNDKMQYRGLIDEAVWCNESLSRTGRCGPTPMVGTMQHHIDIHLVSPMDCVTPINSPNDNLCSKSECKTRIL